MKTGFAEFWQATKDICFPPVCLVCNTDLANRPDRGDIFLCTACLTQVKLLCEPLCSWCGKNLPDAAGPNHLCGLCLKRGWYFTCARSVVLYQGIMAEMIQSFKYGDNRAMLPVFASLKESLPHLRGLQEPDLILPVPLHRERLRQRGFNQALVLAKTFFPGLKSKIDTSALVRSRRTVPQTGLNGAARRKNIKGAFKAVSARVVDRNILLIDDVFTTGTTVSECARVLCRAGAREVQVLTLARSEW